MEFVLNFNAKDSSSEILSIVPCFTKEKDDKFSPVLSALDKDSKKIFDSLKSSSNFLGKSGQTFSFYTKNGSTVLLVGLGEKSKVTFEIIRREFAKVTKSIQANFKEASIDLDALTIKSKKEETLSALVEAIELSLYKFDKYLSKKEAPKLKKVLIDTKDKKTSSKKLIAALESAQIITDSVCFARDLVNEAPNVLNSVAYSKLVQKDMKGVSGVKVKVLGKAELKKHKMGMFLSVNAGSAYEPQLVHLTYTPKKSTKKTKHIALVGKGLTFDSGGYSLKPSKSMINMKTDMGGSATVYAAFRAVVKQSPNTKISCFLGITDNAVSNKATYPDSIVTAKNGKTVEILNTDAEGRLVLGDVLTYASEQKPDVIIDAATLTGACLVSLGTEVCGLMGNDDKLAESLLKAAKSAEENMWQLPIIPEYRNDMKSTIADLRNIGGSPYAGTSKAAAFLEEFVGEGISWAHLDIAGICDSQAHLPYCPAKGGSGLIVRSLIKYIQETK